MDTRPRHVTAGSYDGKPKTEVVVRDSENVVVVAAGSAWPFYRLCGAYVCQPGRTFQDAGRMAFYSNRQIFGVAARIERIVPSIELSQAEAARRSLSLDPAERRLGEIVAAALDDAWAERDAQVVVLSTYRSPDTVRFEPVVHRGPHAWTQNQRYARLGKLMSARSTDDLAPVVADESAGGP